MNYRMHVLMISWLLCSVSNKFSVAFVLEFWYFGGLFEGFEALKN